MKKYEKLMNMSPVKAFIVLGLPSVLRQLIDELNGLVDAVFLGNFFGSDAVASMSIVLPFMLLFIALSALISSGTLILIGKELGRGQINEANKTANFSVLLSLLSGLLLGLIGFFVTPLILSLYTLSETTMYFAKIYMQVISLGLPVIMISGLLKELIYTEGHVKMVVIMTIFQLISNVILNYVLIKLLSLSVVMIAIGTIISMMIEVVVMYLFIQSDKMAIKIKISFKSFSIKKLQVITMTGMPTFTTMVLLALTLGIESKIISSFGSSALSVQTITGYIFSASSSVASGLLSASLVLMSYSVGREDFKRFMKLLNISLIFVTGSVVILNLPLVLNYKGVTQLFTSSIYVMKMIKIPAMVYGLSAPIIFFTNVYLYVMSLNGMEKVSTTIFALQQLFIFIPLLFVFKNFGFNYAISAQPISEMIGAGITLLYLPRFYMKSREMFNKQS